MVNSPVVAGEFVLDDFLSFRSYFSCNHGGAVLTSLCRMKVVNNKSSVNPKMANISGITSIGNKR